MEPLTAKPNRRFKQLVGGVKAANSFKAANNFAAAAAAARSAADLDPGRTIQPRPNDSVADSAGKSPLAAAKPAAPAAGHGHTGDHAKHSERNTAIFEKHKRECFAMLPATVKAHLRQRGLGVDGSAYAQTERLVSAVRAEVCVLRGPASRLGPPEAVSGAQEIVSVVTSFGKHCLAQITCSGARTARRCSAVRTAPRELAATATATATGMGTRTRTRTRTRPVATGGWPWLRPPAVR